MHAASTIVYPAGRNLYLNLTNRCSCDCTFCLRRFTWEVFGHDLRLPTEPPVADVLTSVEAAVQEEEPDELVFCGLGEPTLRLDAVLAVTSWALGERLRTRLDTNGCGQLSAPGIEVVAALSEAGLDAASVSLNTADPDEYVRLCRPHYPEAHEAVIRFASGCVAAGIETTLTALDGLGVDLAACAAVADDIGAGFRVRGCAGPPTPRQDGRVATARRRSIGAPARRLERTR